MHKLVLTVALCAALGACAPGGQPGHGEPGTAGVNETTGVAAAGNLIGSQIAAALDRADRKALQDSTATALENSPPNQVTPWHNSDSGSYGTVTPGPVQQVASGQYCRDFQQTIIVSGKEQQGRGRACRQSDGTWKTVQ